MISADRLAALQAEADQAAVNHARGQEELAKLGVAANASVGTDAQIDRFSELMDNYSRYTGTLDVGTYARLQAQRALAGLPTAEGQAYTQKAWEVEKARRTAEDPTWAWSPCKIGAAVDEIEPMNPQETYDEWKARWPPGVYPQKAERDAEGSVDPVECKRRQARLVELEQQARFYEQKRREYEATPKVFRDLYNISDFLINNLIGSVPVIGQAVGALYSATTKYMPLSKNYDIEADRTQSEAAKFGNMFKDAAIGAVKSYAAGKLKGVVKEKAMRYVKRGLERNTNTIRALADRVARPLSSVRNLQRLPNDAAAALANNRRN